MLGTKSLQQLIYQQLPQNVKREIYNNPETHPEYNQVITNLNIDVLKTLKSKVKLSSNKISFLKIMLEVYYHIKLNPPRGKKTFKAPDAWEDFIVKNNYPMYDEYIDYVDKWPKFMLLLYNTYKFAYNEYYKIKQGPQPALGVWRTRRRGRWGKGYTLPEYNRKTNDFLQYIIKLYSQIDKISTLQELRFWGYP